MYIVPSNPLESARAKVDRAKYHLRQLDDEIHSDGNAKKYGISFDHKTQTNELLIKALVPHGLFVHYSIVAGEVIGHARSALEHAVWEIVPVAIPGRTGFPVFRLETKADRVKPDDRCYDRHGIRMIHGINTRAEAVIKAAQPFGPNFQTNLLYVLNELWNTDKHRLLNFCIAYPRAIQLLFAYPNGTFRDRHIPMPDNVKDGTELFRESHPGTDVKVIAEVDISTIVFDGGTFDGKPVSELLLKLTQFSERIIDALAKTI